MRKYKEFNRNIQYKTIKLCHFDIIKQLIVEL